MSIGTWAADGLLVVFFFLTGLELKKEFVIGDLKSPSTAIVPIAAAFGGVAVPAIIYTALNFTSPTALHGWGDPHRNRYCVRGVCSRRRGYFPPLGDACLPADPGSGR